MNRKEYNNCVKEYADGLYRFALKNLRNEDDAKDVVQECFTKFWEKHENVSYEKAKSYLFTSVYNMSINLSKRKSRWRTEEAENINEISRETDFELKEALDKSIDQLKEPQKSILLLRDLEGYNYKEIGEMIKLTESQVKVYLFRARQKVKEQIKALNLA